MSDARKICFNLALLTLGPFTQHLKHLSTFKPVCCNQKRKACRKLLYSSSANRRPVASIATLYMIPISSPRKGVTVTTTKQKEKGSTGHVQATKDVRKKKKITRDRSGASRRLRPHCCYRRGRLALPFGVLFFTRKQTQKYRDNKTQDHSGRHMMLRSGM